jgi:Xaa-Pro aminopeptidase
VEVADLSERPRRALTRASGAAPDTYGELGIRHEDTVAVTNTGCENLAPEWSGTPEEPAVV